MPLRFSRSEFMHLIQSIEHDWRNPIRRQQMLNAGARQQQQVSALAIDEASCRHDPYRAWGSRASRVLASSALPQRSPLALLVPEGDDRFSTVAVQSASVWFADRGQSSLIQCQLLASLAAPFFDAPPAAHSVKRLAALLLGESLARRTHLIVCLPAEEHAAWHAIVSACSQYRYRVMGVEHEGTEPAHRHALRQEIASMDGGELHLMHDSTSSAASISSQHTRPMAGGGQRKVKLGEFSVDERPHGTVVAIHMPCPSATPHPSEADASLKRPAPAPQQPVPTVPVAPKSTPPSVSKVLAERSSTRRAIASDADVQRRQMFQQNIRKKADGVA
jgi:hypothetical protein